MTEQEKESLVTSPDMWHKIDGDPYLRMSMGIGDAINLSGAAIYLAKRDGPIVWHAWEGHEKTIRSIFALNPEISVVAVPNWDVYPFVDTEPCHSLLVNREVVGPSQSRVDLFEHIYASHDIPYRVRWDVCPVEEASRLVSQDSMPKEKQYCFVHEYPEYGRSIDRSLLPKDLPWYGHDRKLDMSILAYVDTLKAATEIHAIDSSFFHLVESIETKARLFLHRYAKEHMPVWNNYRTRHKWSVIG